MITSAAIGVGSRARTKIEAALRRLPFQAGGEERLPHVVTLLTQIANTKPEPDTAFRRVGRAQCERELKALGNAANMLVGAISKLHAPTIAALAAPPVLWLAREELKKLAEQAADAARHANVDDVSTASTVQPRNRPSPVVADILADGYEKITGKRPTVGTCEGIAYGPFLDLVRDIFIAMDISDSPEVASRNSAGRHRLR